MASPAGLWGPGRVGNASGKVRERPGGLSEWFVTPALTKTLLPYNNTATTWPFNLTSQVFITWFNKETQIGFWGIFLVQRVSL